jgi:hypothetical protein
VPIAVRGESAHRGIPRGLRRRATPGAPRQYTSRQSRQRLKPPVPRPRPGIMARRLAPLLLPLLLAAAVAVAGQPTSSSGCRSYTSKGLIQPATGSLQDVVVVQASAAALPPQPVPAPSAQRCPLPPTHCLPASSADQPCAPFSCCLQDAFVVADASITLDVSHRRVGALKVRQLEDWPTQQLRRLLTSTSRPCLPGSLAQPLSHPAADHPGCPALLQHRRRCQRPPHNRPKVTRPGQVGVALRHLRLRAGWTSLPALVVPAGLP